MKRRGFIALLAGAAMSPHLTAGAADEPAKVLRLAMLVPLPPGPGILALENQLRTLGREEGHNLRIDYVQFDSADPDRTLAMAVALVGRGVDVIYVNGPEVALKSAITAMRLSLRAVCVARSSPTADRVRSDASR